MYKYILKKIEKANTLLNEMKKDGYGNLSVITLAEEQIRKLQDAEMLPDSFPSISDVPYEKLNAYDRILEKFINSPWTTEEGRNDIYKKRLSSFQSNNKITKKRALQLYDIFDTDVYHQVIEKGLLDSKQIIDMVLHTRRGSATVLSFEQAFNALLQRNDISEDESRIFVERFLKKKKKRIEK